MKPLSDCRLYAFVDTAYLRGRAPEEVARQLCLGGADLLQLRAKQSSLEEVRRMAGKILPITRASSVGLVINDHLSVAQEVGAAEAKLPRDFFRGTPAQIGRVHKRIETAVRKGLHWISLCSPLSGYRVRANAIRHNQCELRASKPRWPRTTGASMSRCSHFAHDSRLQNLSSQARATACCAGPHRSSPRL